MIPEASDEVEPAAEGFDIAGDGVDGGKFATFDLAEGSAGSPAFASRRLGLAHFG